MDGSGDVCLLRSFRAATEENHPNPAALSDVDPITTANVHSELAHSTADRFDVARISGDDSINSQTNRSARDGIPQ